ncbi:MAG TPA: M23 family metallopeptidase [Prosthecobacter sp.]|nr:M23 family metallopeptidase [Prosthecobacter sp.]
MVLLLISAPAGAADSIRCLLADGFDFPVGKPNGDSYYKARGYWPNGHLGEDWNGRGGGDSDLGAPIYATARGIVIISENVGVGWGNCIILRHAYRDTTGKVAMVDSLYGHLLQRHSKVGQIVEKGQLIGTMGSNNGMYPAHLHFEIRKNLRIGMNRSQFARDNSNYYSPTDFINKHRVLEVSLTKYPIPTGGFAPYGRSLADARSDSGLGGIEVPIMPTVRPGLPATGPSDDDEDFWAKLRSRLKEGQVTDGVEKAK